MIDKIFGFIENFLSNSSTDDECTKFSIDLEFMLVDTYEEALREHRDVTLMLNDELPDVCDWWEPGYNVDEFKDKIKKEYYQAWLLFHQYKVA